MKRLLLLALVVGIGTLWWEWDHLALKPRAEDWQPPGAAAPDTQPLPRQAFRGDIEVSGFFSEIISGGQGSRMIELISALAR